MFCGSLGFSVSSPSDPPNLNDEIYSKLTKNEKQFIYEYYCSYFKLKHYYTNVLLSAQRKSYVMQETEGIPNPPDSSPILTRIDDFEFFSNTSEQEFYRMDHTTKFIRSATNNFS